MAKERTAQAWLALIALGIVLVAGIIQGIRQDTLAPYVLIISTILVLAGLAIGFLNITKKEQMPMLIVAIALGAINYVLIWQVIPDSLGILASVLKAILTNILVVVVPIAIVTALKAGWDLTKR